MPKLRRLELDEDARQELEHCRDRDPHPYMRERAAALLKIADGHHAAKVAQSELLKPHDPDIVYGWMDRYQQGGLAGLRVHPGRGRKPAFSPCPS